MCTQTKSHLPARARVCTHAPPQKPCVLIICAFVCLALQLRAMMPHSKKEVKLDRKDKLHEIIPEVSVSVSLRVTVRSPPTVTCTPTPFQCHSPLQHFPSFQICEMRNCNNCLYFEMRKKRDCYLWFVTFTCPVSRVLWRAFPLLARLVCKAKMLLCACLCFALFSFPLLFSPWRARCWFCSGCPKCPMAHLPSSTLPTVRLCAPVCACVRMW